MTRTAEYRVRGKWVLAGEHSVLRGGAALVFPHPENELCLRVHSEATARLGDQPELEELFTQAVDLGALTPNWRDLQQKMEIQSTIPVGAGLGSSAAVCVAVARWLLDGVHGSASKQEAVISLARSLEDHYHGRSSGMDVTVAAIGRPIVFRAGQEPEVLELEWEPRVTFHDTGIQSFTRAAVDQVARQIARTPSAHEEIDRRMGHAVELGLVGLRQKDLSALVQAFKLAQSCFEEWGLVPEPIRSQILALESRGAQAVKLTGAGQGGTLVALWA